MHTKQGTHKDYAKQKGILKKPKPQTWVLEWNYSTRHEFSLTQWASTQSESGWLPNNNHDAVSLVDISCQAGHHCSFGKMGSPQCRRTAKDFCPLAVYKELSGTMKASQHGGSVQNCSILLSQCSVTQVCDIFNKGLLLSFDR